MTEIENIIYPKKMYSQIKFIPSLQNNLLALLATSYVTLQYSMHHIP